MFFQWVHIGWRSVRFWFEQDRSATNTIVSVETSRVSNYTIRFGRKTNSFYSTVQNPARELEMNHKNKKIVTKIYLLPSRPSSRETLTERINNETANAFSTTRDRFEIKNDSVPVIVFIQRGTVKKKKSNNKNRVRKQ